jgi:hypothetical protein
MIDFKELATTTIQSQYAASPRIRALVEAFAKEIDPNPDINVFYKNIFDLDTASGVGLDIWGGIVGIGRILEIGNSDDAFGFLGSLLKPFDNAPFYAAGVTSFYRLEDEAYRRLIYYKAMANISSAEIPAMNKLLRWLHEDKKAYVLETGVPMEVRYVFEFYLEPCELAIFKNYGMLARGGGVGWDFYQIDSDNTFGFGGSGLQPFNQGVFDVYGLQEIIHEG